MADGLEGKRALHAAFWRGEGPSLMLIPPSEQDLYDLNNYPERFRDPWAMWESEMRRAIPLRDWPTDGIPTARPNLGVIFIPAMAGQGYQLPENAMPWPGKPLPREVIRAARDVDVTAAETMQLAAEFYAIHHDAQQGDIAPYQADTQGVFDIAHLLNGDHTFYQLPDPREADWIDELLEICVQLYTRVSRHLKSLLNEPATAMIHGHGTSQGVYFPHVGTRMAEDTAVLLSPATIDRFILPTIREATVPFGGVFVHFCGHHKPLLERLCRMNEVRAIDLGNPNLFDSRWVLEQCAKTGTVLYSRLAAEPEESWAPYVHRLAGLVTETRARVILRPMVFPAHREACQAMLDLWHELTA